MKERNGPPPPPKQGEKVQREGPWRLTLSEKVLLRIVKMAEYLKRAQSTVFSRYGITFPQYNVLRVLEGSDNGQQRLSDVSRILLVAVSNLSGLVRRLEKEGLILRKRDPGDDRVTIVEITQRGRDILKGCDDEKNRDLERILAPMSDGEKRFLVATITKTLGKGPSPKIRRNA
ncbi:MAG: MarR family transcriptional regulator [Thermodesulfobacteriota bacterium]